MIMALGSFTGIRIGVATVKALSEAKNATASATSEGFPKRPITILFFWAFAMSRGIFAVISVEINPGHTQFARIPLVPNSAAIARINEHIAPLLAA